MGLFSGIMDLLFPPRCAFCRRFLNKGESGICRECEKTLLSSGADCKMTGDFFAGCVAPLNYEGLVRDSVLRFKFKEATSYAGVYGKIIADCVRRNFEGKYDIISWVPLSRERLKKRGYDQAMLLALAAALELSDVAAETLIKHTDVPAQSGAGSAEKRRANISGVYTVSDPELIAGKRVLLIDDIITSGSTLSECAKTLLEAGAEEVRCATLAAVKDQ